MSSLRTVLPTAPSSRRLFAVAAVVALLEGVLRIGIVTVAEPHFGDLWILVFVLLCPPVAVFGLAAVVPTAREVLEANGTRRRGDAPWNDRVGELAGRMPALTAVALVGHAVALVGGIVLFLLVDTPIRYGLYRAGYGELFTFAVVTYGPFAGIGIGALVAWIVPAIAAPASAPRPLAWIALGHLLFVGFAVGVLSTVLWAGNRIEAAELAFSDTAGAVVLLAIGGLTLVFGAAAWLAGTLAIVVDRFAGTPAPQTNDRSRRSFPIARLAIAVLVVTALVTTAGAVRMNEVRPTDASPEPLPDDPDELYATAVENTDRTSHEYRWIDASDGSEEPVFELRIDRTDRRLATSFEGIDSYFSHGTFHQGASAPLPGYAMMKEERPPRLAEPSPEVENWTVVAEDGDEITLELTDPNDVYVAQTGSELEEVAEDPEVHASRVRMTVDTERKALSRGELRLNVSDPSFSDRTADSHAIYEYETDVDVERPDELGSPSAGELLWRLFAY